MMTAATEHRPQHTNLFDPWGQNAKVLKECLLDAKSKLIHVPYPYPCPINRAEPTNPGKEMLIGSLLVGMVESGPLCPAPNCGIAAKG